MSIRRARCGRTSASVLDDARYDSTERLDALGAATSLNRCLEIARANPVVPVRVHRECMWMRGSDSTPAHAARALAGAGAPRGGARKGVLRSKRLDPPAPTRFAGTLRSSPNTVWTRRDACRPPLRAPCGAPIHTVVVVLDFTVARLQEARGRSRSPCIRSTRPYVRSTPASGHSTRPLRQADRASGRTIGLSAVSWRSHVSRTWPSRSTHRIAVASTTPSGPAA